VDAMQILRKIGVGLAGLAAAYMMKKITKSIEKQIAAHREAEINATDERERQTGAIKTLRLDPKTGVYTTDDAS
jgi:demethoxyubiquinone hydroxylase (CLK1/Coq7/Cat5 family)